MRTDQGIIVRRSDYRPPAFLVDHVALEFDLDPARTRVRSRLSLRRNPDAAAEGASLVLNGEDLRLVDIRLDGEPLSPERWRLVPGGLVVDDLPESCELDTESELSPVDNTRLEGLY